MSRSKKDGRRGGAHKNGWHGIGDSWMTDMLGKRYEKQKAGRARRREAKALIVESYSDYIDELAEQQAMDWWLYGEFEDIFDPYDHDDWSDYSDTEKDDQIDYDPWMNDHFEYDSDWSY
jgi:hypothetical protein